MVRVALCDDHRIVRSGLRRILEAEDDLVVVGEAGSISEAVSLAAADHPDVFVMDLGLPDGSGLTATAEVRRVSPLTRVLVLTVHDDIAYLRRAFEAGADGYMVKEAADVELVQAIRQVARGRQYVHPSLGAALLVTEAPAARRGGPGGDLSNREDEVLRLIALGLTNTEIAERLYVSVRTIETHRAHIHQKLDIRSRAELVRFARETGLLDDTPPTP
ncbi:MAG: two component LuxR family transcriptional regulator [Acidimicrobiaceae bacterium]|nr:MAG: two component LuxR family transcriptional regulator [Acidimicrobiaceae bacterium]